MSEKRDMERPAGQRRVITKEVIERFAARSTKASAQLEGRGLPPGYVRSPQVEKLLAARQPRSEEAPDA